MKWLVGGIFVMLASIVSTFGFWLLEPPNPPSVSIEQSARGANGVPQTEFRAGEVLYIYSQQRVLRIVPRTATQSIWNEDTQTMAARYSTLLSPTPTVEGILFPVPLPTHLEPGNYTHRVKIDYVLNPLRRDEYFNLPNVHFKIVK